jgi:hypothetical protein
MARGSGENDLSPIVVGRLCQTPFYPNPGRRKALPSDNPLPCFDQVLSELLRRGYDEISAANPVRRCKKCA